MLFAHGFGCDQHMWRFVAPRFADRFRVVLFDHVGAGGSDLTAYDIERYSTLDGYADDVVEICRDLGLRCSTTTPSSSTTARRAATCPRPPDGTIVKVNADLPLADRAPAGGPGRQPPVRRPAGAGRADLPRDALRPDAADAGLARTRSPSTSCAPTARGCRCWSTRCWCATTSGEPLIVRTAVFDATRPPGVRAPAAPRQGGRRGGPRPAPWRLASTLQQTLVPPRCPGRPGPRGRGGLPAGRAAGAEVGGDFYDVFQVGEGDWVVAIGDVCGKGVAGRGGDGARPLHAPGGRGAARPRPSAALRGAQRGAAAARDRPVLHRRDGAAPAGRRRLARGDGVRRAPPAPAPPGRRLGRAAGARGTLLGVMATARTTDTERAARPG